MPAAPSDLLRSTARIIHAPLSTPHASHQSQSVSLTIGLPHNRQSVANPLTIVRFSHTTTTIPLLHLPYICAPDTQTPKNKNIKPKINHAPHAPHVTGLLPCTPLSQQDTIAAARLPLSAAAASGASVSAFGTVRVYRHAGRMRRAPHADVIRDILGKERKEGRKKNRLREGLFSRGRETKVSIVRWKRQNTKRLHCVVERQNTKRLHCVVERQTPPPAPPPPATVSKQANAAYSGRDIGKPPSAGAGHREEKEKKKRKGKQKTRPDQTRPDEKKRQVARRVRVV
ncbi:LANO_0F07998g1_1 [Lachancea nothofagi CBS 11611]|uniref:LANO_0F07998g1_1 n=1 Tax=Lachancea nothofagi CBS 11611 TaxID=1266666 RepID=A0A1G4K985_9SACH|nr:LANO_0F07998g1_1 [Lachancea nothofagi CBS 11611]